MLDELRELSPEDLCDDLKEMSQKVAWGYKGTMWPPGKTLNIVTDEDKRKIIDLFNEMTKVVANYKLVRKSRTLG